MPRSARRASTDPSLRYHEVDVTRGETSIWERERQASQGPVLAEISNAMVALYKECYGKGPTKARTTFSDDLVVCVLEGGFQTAERTLRKHGRADAVQTQREAFQEVLRERFISTIEDLTGRKVKSFISGVDTETETSAELFVLEPAPAFGDEREAVQAWAKQTVRRTRELRDEQVALREEQVQTRSLQKSTRSPAER